MEFKKILDRLKEEYDFEYEPQHEVNVLDEEDKRRYTLRVDFAIFCKNSKLAVEIDGVRWHSSRRQTSKSIWRDNLLRKKGYIPLHFWDYEVLEYPEIVKEEIENIIKELLKQKT